MKENHVGISYLSCLCLSESQLNRVKDKLKELDLAIPPELPISQTVTFDSENSKVIPLEGVLIEAIGSPEDASKLLSFLQDNQVRVFYNRPDSIDPIDISLLNNSLTLFPGHEQVIASDQLRSLTSAN